MKKSLYFIDIIRMMSYPPPPHTHTQDIRQQRLHRQRRGAELQKLRQTLGSLQAKSNFHSDQVDYYRHYITSCLDHLTAKRYTHTHTHTTTRLFWLQTGQRSNAVIGCVLQ